MPAFRPWIPLVLVGLSTACSAQDTPASKPTRLLSSRVSQPPAVDGDGSDPAWRAAKELSVRARAARPDASGTTDLSIKSVHTKTHVYVVVSWGDATRDVTHKTWVWDPTKKRYSVGPDREDVLALAFEHTGPFEASMLSGTEATWDVWQWKAARTGPAGYAMDKTHRFSKTRPQGKAKPFPVAGDKARQVWIARPEDAGDSPQRSQPAPDQHRGDRVPHYVPGEPSGSAADVRARGTWRDGRWTVELSRKLNTGHSDDTPLDTTRTYGMGAAVFDRSEHSHHRVSTRIELVFTSASEAGSR